MERSQCISFARAATQSERTLLSARALARTECAELCCWHAGRRAVQEAAAVATQHRQWRAGRRPSAGYDFRPHRFMIHQIYLAKRCG